MQIVMGPRCALPIILLLEIVSVSVGLRQDADDLNACSRLRSLSHAESRIYSQYGEDGVLISLLDIIGIEEHRKYFVEFGVESGQECNTRVLRERLGFEGLSMDSGHENFSINLMKEFITEQNILELFAKYRVPANFDILSIDIDMFDLWILAKILRSGLYRPRIIIVETNPTLCVQNIQNDYKKMNAMPLSVIHPDLTAQKSWDGTRYAGANPKAFQTVADRFGYEMVFCERCGVNCFLVLRESLPGECNDSFDLLPLVPYPCFHTVNDDGSMNVGHPLDGTYRHAIFIDNMLLNSMTQQRTFTSPDSFLGFEHVDSSRMGYACGTATPKLPRGWGGDWCSYIYRIPSIESNINPFTVGVSAFAENKFDEALAAFSQILEGHLISDTLGPCRSSHVSEIGCKNRAFSSFNAAVSALNAASQSNQRNPNVTDQLLKTATYYTDMALFYSPSDDHFKGFKQLLSFLLLGEHGIREKLQAKVMLNVLLTPSHTSSKTMHAVESLNASYCDDLESIAFVFCKQYGISSENCKQAQISLEEEIMANVLPYSHLPFNFFPSREETKLQGADDVAQTFPKFSRFKPPPCVLDFPAVVALMRGCEKKVV